MSIRNSLEAFIPAIAALRESGMNYAGALVDLLTDMQAMTDEEFVAAVIADHAKPPLVELLSGAGAIVAQMNSDKGEFTIMAKAIANLTTLVQQRAAEIVERRKRSGLE